MFVSAFESNYLPEDAQNDYGRSQRDERNAVSDGVADLNRLVEIMLRRDLKATHSALCEVISVAIGF